MHCAARVDLLLLTRRKGRRRFGAEHACGAKTSGRCQLGEGRRVRLMSCSVASRATADAPLATSSAAAHESSGISKARSNSAMAPVPLGPFIDYLRLINSCSCQ
jgi:hypothetical protein